MKEVIMRKYISVILTAAMLTGSVCVNTSPVAAEDTGKSIQIVTTIFPEYDWVQNILGDNPGNAEVTMLLENGVDLHSFQPTVEDILKMSTCDLFVYIGGESDDWVDDALEEAINNDMVVINLLEALGSSAKEEEIVEGMQADHDHDHDHEDEDHEDEDHEAEDHDHEDEDHDHEDEDHDHEDEDHDHDHEEAEYDEHVWLSLRNASVLVKTLSDAIQTIDPDNASVYESNAEAYIESLNALDEEYKTAISEASLDTVLFGDRFPFRYLTDDYGLTYYAAFVGCSAETEASFETIAFLSGKVDELSLHTVLTIEGTDHRIADTIVQNTKTKDQQILSLDSMQSTTAKDVQNGLSFRYVGVEAATFIMENNLTVLKDALK